MKKSKKQPETQKRAALQAKPEGRRTAAKQAEIDKAVEQQKHNEQVWRDVVNGKKPKSAMKYEDEGGEVIRIGWPDGYKPEKDVTYASVPGAAGAPRSLLAHEKLFKRGTTTRVTVTSNEKGEIVDSKIGGKRGRPNGAATRGNGNFDAKLKITILHEGNPKKEGTLAHENWKRYRNGMTVEEYYKAGGKTSTLKWDSERGFIKLA